MAEKSPKRLKIEASLAEDPADPFLRYALAMQCLSDGETAEGRRLLSALIADCPEEVAACQQLGQSYIESEEFTAAGVAFREGIKRARTAGNTHAEGEMEVLLEQIEGLE
jgi:hypothetical protein